MAFSVNCTRYSESDVPEYLNTYYRQQFDRFVRDIAVPGDNMFNAVDFLNCMDPFDSLSDMDVFFLWRSMGCPIDHAVYAGSAREMMMDALSDSLGFVSLEDVVMSFPLPNIVKE